MNVRYGSALGLILLLATAMVAGAEEPQPTSFPVEELSGRWAPADAVQTVLGKVEGDRFFSGVQFTVDKDPNERWKKHPDFSFESASKHLKKSGESVLASGSIKLQTSEEGSREIDILYTRVSGTTHVRWVIRNVGATPFRVIYIPGTTPHKALLFLEMRSTGQSKGFMAFKRANAEERPQ